MMLRGQDDGGNESAGLFIPVILLLKEEVLLLL